LVWTARRVTRGTLAPSRRVGAWLVALGGAYATVMLLRLVLGVTILRDVRWFASPVPTVFHIGLAAYLLIYGHFHYRSGRR
jgi:hypothetical protein